MIEKKKIVCYITRFKYCGIVLSTRFKMFFLQCNNRNRTKERDKEYALQNKIKMLSERISNGEKIDIDRQEALKVNCRSLKWKNEEVLFLDQRPNGQMRLKNIQKYFLEFNKIRQQSKSI